VKPGNRCCEGEWGNQLRHRPKGTHWYSGDAQGNAMRITASQKGPGGKTSIHDLRATWPRKAAPPTLEAHPGSQRDALSPIAKITKQHVLEGDDTRKTKTSPEIRWGGRKKKNKENSVSPQQKSSGKEHYPGRSGALREDRVDTGGQSEKNESFLKKNPGTGQTRAYVPGKSGGETVYCGKEALCGENTGAIQKIEKAFCPPSTAIRLYGKDQL